MLLQKAKDSAFWAKASTDDAYKPLREELFRLWEKYALTDMPSVKFSEFRIYYENGSRQEYETSYFKRRHALNASALLALLYPEEEKYLVKLQDCLWALLDEYTWVLPAHTGPIENPPTPIDLFCAETGFAIAEIDYLLADRLHPLVRSRIRKECKERILEPYLNRTYNWEHGSSNWTAVCMGSVTAAILYLFPEKFPLIETRMLAAMNNFLNSFSEDGICYEGFAYWAYGLGFFLYAADLVKDFTNGRINLLADPRVMKTADYPQRVMVAKGQVPSFSDCGTNGRLPLGIIHYLASLFPNLVRCPDIRYTTFSDGCARWGLHLRSFVWYNPEAEVYDTGDTHEYWSASSQILIRRTGKYGFAAKGGCNAELHNHNDLGSFLVVADGRQLLCDPGSGLYSAQYFNQHRYEDFSASSRGHSVPIIDGVFQSPGSVHRAQADFTDGTLTLDLSAAYAPHGEILSAGSCVRTFTLEDNRITLNDRFASGHTVTERLIAGAAPVYEDGILRIGSLTLTFCGYTQPPVITPAPKAGYWCVDFPDAGETFTAEITFD